MFEKIGVHPVHCLSRPLNQAFFFLCFIGTFKSLAGANNSGRFSNKCRKFELLWFCVTSLCHWFKKLAPIKTCLVPRRPSLLYDGARGVVGQVHCSRVLHPSHDAPRSLFAHTKPAPGEEAESEPKPIVLSRSCLPGLGTYYIYLQFLFAIFIASVTFNILARDFGNDIKV